MTLSVRAAQIDDLELVMRLVGECIEGMRLTGIDQWDKNYPDMATIEADIWSGTAFLSVHLDEISGMVVLNEHQDPEYSEVPWTAHGRTAVVHRLMVAPHWEGRGVGRALMRFVEERAITLGYDCIRLDAFCMNQRAVHFYESVGYRQAGRVRFRKGHFYCLEKSIAAC